MSKDLWVNLNDKNPIENCSKYDEEKNILFFERHNWEKYEYNFNTNKIIKK